MLLNQETLRLVFGLKLKGLRTDRGLSLKDLSKKTGLSPSYLNEIEKGKKYPKTEKILLLAQALNEKIEDLISLELKKEFQLVQQLIDKKFLTGMPFDIFGIPAQTVFQLLAEHPKKMQALVGTLIEIARSHHIEVDDLLFAFLRSYLDMHKNYFPSLEERARNARNKYQIDWTQPPEKLLIHLEKVLLEQCRVKVYLDIDFNELFQQPVSLEYFVIDKGLKVYLSNKLNLFEKIFILCRELGYHELKVKNRSLTSLTQQFDSFDSLFNHFSVSYFASSLLIPEDSLKKSLADFFQQAQWNEQDFIQITQPYSCTVETFFHRLTQILPKHFDLGQLFYLRYEFDTKSNKYQISKELHLSSLHSPHRVKGSEHYCKRWLIHQLTLKHASQTQKLSDDVNSKFGIQRSAYVGTPNEYLVLAASYQTPNKPDKIQSVCLGLLMNKKLEQKINFTKSENIPNVIVGETCERCSLMNCSDRQADLDMELNPERHHSILKKIQEIEKGTLTI